VQKAPQLDLDVPRDAGALIGTTLVLFARHILLFLSLTLLIVGPIAALAAGVWGGGVSYGSDDDISVVALVGTVALSGLVPVLVSALHVVVVRDLGEGQVPGVGKALRAAAPRFPLAVVTALVYGLLVSLGTVLFVIPRIWVFVAGYFAVQVAVVERRAPLDAFRRSSELVDDRWWRTAGTLALGWALLAAASFWVDRVPEGVDSGVGYVVLYTFVQALELSLTALLGTLMYFSLRARKEHPFGAGPASVYLPPTPAADVRGDL
jgi:hypothetical protein